MPKASQMELLQICMTLRRVLMMMMMMKYLWSCTLGWTLLLSRWMPWRHGNKQIQMP